jgi:hypothetical protein
MKKLIKTIILLPMYPLIWFSRSEFFCNECTFNGRCKERGEAMLRWRNS